MRYEEKKDKKIKKKKKKEERVVKEIKKLQQEIVKLEYCNDFDCMEMENDLEKKKERLYSIPMYQEYIKRMDILNDILAESTFQIEKYINSKV